MIIDHPTETQEDEWWNREPRKVVQCRCGALARSGVNEHDAVSKAREDGFRTVRGRTLADPREWRCKGC